jgi:hypothetical protein
VAPAASRRRRPHLAPPPVQPRLAPATIPAELLHRRRGPTPYLSGFGGVRRRPASSRPPPPLPPWAAVDSPAEERPSPTEAAPVSGQGCTRLPDRSPTSTAKRTRNTSTTWISCRNKHEWWMLLDLRGISTGWWSRRQPQRRMAPIGSSSQAPCNILSLVLNSKCRVSKT